MLSTGQDLRHWTALDGKTFFVCIGAAKCATSWLFHYLSGIEGAAVSPLKEVHFFDAHFPQRALGDMEAMALNRLKFHIEQGVDPRTSATFQASLDRVQMLYDCNAYFGHFARLCQPDTKTFCDITPAYSAIGKAGLAELKRYAASQHVRLRVLFIMRDPIERFWSQLRYLEQVNPASNARIRWREALESLPLLARSDYMGIVKALDSVVAPEERMYLFYETLFEERALRSLCHFAGLPYKPSDGAQRFNETTVKREMPEGMREMLHFLLAPQYQFCRTRFGRAVPDAWEH